MVPLDDTIVAIASAPGGAPRGIVRISGTRAVDCAQRCFAGAALSGLKSARAVHGELVLEADDLRFPATALVWPSSRSYTRAPTVEFHTIGSPPLLEATLRTLCAHGARLARPGEFTLRAFLAGRMDLTQAEAVLGVIDATSRDELDVALAQLAGGLAQPLHALRGELLDLLAHLEAGLDFVEEDIQFISTAELTSQLGHAAEQVAAIVERMQTRASAHHATRVVLMGMPNVGKSSLFNQLSAGSQSLFSQAPVSQAPVSQALVSQVAGTTRDYLTALVQWDEFPVELVDTAGWERADGGAVLERAAEMTRAAQVLAEEQQQRADIQLLCLDASRELLAAESSLLQQSPKATPRLVVWTKADLPAIPLAAEPAIERPTVFFTSATTGQGIASLREAILQAAKGLRLATHEVVAGTAARCRESLRQAAEALARGHEVAARGQAEELVAAELRLALEALGEVVGAVYTDDVLDRIFSRFCIGK